MKERYEIKKESSVKMAFGLILVFAIYAYWYDLGYIGDYYELDLETMMVIVICSFLFVFAISGILVSKLCKTKYIVELTDSDLIIYNGNYIIKKVGYDEIGMLRHCGGADQLSDSILISGKNADDKILSLNNISKQSDTVRPLVKKILTTGNYKKEQKVYKNMMWDEYTQTVSDQF